MEYKIIALDIDGTVTNSEKKITAKTKEKLLQIQKSGKKVVLASGRPAYGIFPVAKELEMEKYSGFILAFNGGKIINASSKEVVYEQTLPSEIIRSLYEDAKYYDIGIITYNDEEILCGSRIDSYIEQESRITGMRLKKVENFIDTIKFPVNKCLMTGEPHYLEGIEKKMKDKYETTLNIFRSEPYFLEIMPKYIDKEKSLEKLLSYLNLNREELICVGDGYNDRSMIEFAGLGVAMANAQDAVKKVADYITLSNDEDGVAHVIEKFM